MIAKIGLRGRLATFMLNLKELAQRQNDDHRNADLKVLQGIKVDESFTR